MRGWISRITAKIRGVLAEMTARTHRLPNRPEITVEGLRGRATGDPSSQPKDRKIGRGEISDFVYGGYPLIVNSSHIAVVTYHRDTQELLFQYLDGSVWAYANQSEQKALAFAQAHSKGDWLWTYIRIRGKGNKHRHRVPAVQIS